MKFKLTYALFVCKKGVFTWLMKTFIFLFCTTVFSLSPENVFSQDAEITLDANQTITVDQVFEIIKKQTDFRFAYRTGMFDNLPKVQLKKGVILLSELLKQSLGENSFNIDLSTDGATIIIKQKTNGQQEIISGKIVDDDGQPVMGITIYVTNNATGDTTQVSDSTTSDFDGNFSLSGTVGHYLVFTGIGYEKQVIQIVAQKPFYNVTLKADNQLEEVVVTGYVDVPVTRSTGSVGKVTANTIEKSGVVSIDQVLKGQISGTSIMNVSGRPGAPAQIRIRGLNSITGDMNPIWIVDGMELQGTLPNIQVGGVNLQNSIFTNGIGAISPNDIESITVLKDAAASALYGARAANGVIVVKTKSGQAGQNRIQLSSSFAISEAPEARLDMMNTAEKIAFERTIYEDFAGFDIYGRVFQILKKETEGLYTNQEAEQLIANLSTIETNWFDEIFRSAFSQRHSLSMSGGNQKTLYYGSANYSTESGVLLKNRLNTFSSQIKVNTKPVDNFQIELQMRTSIRDDRTPNSIIDPFEYATYANTYERPYNDDGTYAFDRSYEHRLEAGNSGGFLYDFNMLQDMEASTRKSKTLSATFDGRIVYDITKNLSLESQIQYTNTSRYVRESADPGSYTSERRNFLINSDANNLDEYNRGYLRESSTNSSDFAIKNLLSYNASVQDKHFINVLLGQELSKTDAGNFFSLLPEYDPILQLGGYPSDFPPNVSEDDLVLSLLGNSGISKRRTSSFFANASYSFDDIHILNGSIRYDGIDIIGNENNFTPLWNISYKTNIHRYLNFEPIDILSLRASYGYTGSIDKNALPFTYLNFNGVFYYNSLQIPTSVVFKSPNIKWQQKLDRNFGLNFSILDHRINAEVNYYNNKVEDLLDLKQLPVSSGVSQVTANVASLVNKGIEFDINGYLVRNDNWRVSLDFNISKNKNEITETFNKDLTDLGVIERQNQRFRSNYFVQGYDASSWFGYEFAGIDPNTGNTLAYVNNEAELNPWDVFTEINGRKVIDMDKNFNHKATVAYIGKKHPDIIGGFGGTVSYKGLTLTTRFNYSVGNHIKNPRYSTSGDYYATDRNRLRFDLNRWRQPGDVTNVGPMVVGGDNSYNQHLYDIELEKADFLKLSFINLSWDLPRETISKFGMDRFTLNWNAQNLFTWTKYKGLDPENNGEFAYPSSLRFALGLNITF